MAPTLSWTQRAKPSSPAFSSSQILRRKWLVHIILVKEDFRKNTICERRMLLWIKNKVTFRALRAHYLYLYLYIYFIDRSHLVLQTPCWVPLWLHVNLYYEYVRACRCSHSPWCSLSLWQSFRHRRSRRPWGNIGEINFIVLHCFLLNKVRILPECCDIWCYFNSPFFTQFDSVKRN